MSDPSSDSQNRPSESTPPTPTRAFSLAQSLWMGSLGFVLVSSAVFATVAFGERWLYQHLGVAGTYLLWTLLFIGGGGAVTAVLNRRVISAKRSYAIFALAFFLYAIGWTAIYFGLNTNSREWLALAAGNILMGLAFARSFGAMRNLFRVVLILFLTNAAGYFLGSILHASVGGKIGMMLWGVAYGLGLGAGIGYALHTCQSAKPSADRPFAKAVG